MNGQEIANVMWRDPRAKDVFLGVYPRDRLPRTLPSFPSAVICNTDRHDEEGEHWTAIYIDETGRGDFFDPYGIPPLYKTFVNFLDKHCVSWQYNKTRLQGLTSAVCGQYCIFFLLHRCRGLSLDTIVHMFGNCCADNDVLVHDFVSVLQEQ